MALILADRVRELTATTGTGSVTLIGSPDGFETFAASIGDGNTTYYTIAEKTGDNWEVGVGTYRSAGNLLERTTVLSSSDGGNKVAFAAGDKDVFVTLPAEKVVSTDAAGTMAYQNANSVAITGGAIDGTTIGSTTPAAGTFTTLTATGQTSLGGAAGSESLRVKTFAGTPNGWLEVTGSSTSTNGVYVTSTASNLYANTNGGAFRFFTDTATTKEQFRVANTASAVNYVQVNGGATGGIPAISAQGSDSTVALSLSAKGGTGIVFFTNSGANRGFRVTHAANSVNYLTAEGSATGQVSRFYTTGTDANISLALQTTGTGAIDLAAGSSGVNISNGGTVTAITRTATGSGYTSIPTVAITAPTTAGGVQATATAQMYTYAATIQAGGTGYTLNDVLTVSGGTPNGSAATYTVTGVTGGVVTAVTVNLASSYTVLPSNPASTTGGTGTGCTLNLLWALHSAFTITNAGSGYVEQPTVTFSGGGGGSGAAAYATVGSASVVRSLGSSLQFYTPAGEQFRVQDSGATSANYWIAQGIGAGNSPYLIASGSDSNVGGFITSKGTGALALRSGSGGTQLQVAHTASAVNYVQVTGGTTGNQAVISSQGSDANVGLLLSTKGTASLQIRTNAGAQTQFRVAHTANAVNFASVTGNISGSAPAFSVDGTDTNIDLALTPKGTGLVRFGTLTATADTAISGYITIKDSGGTTRKLAVIT